MVIVKIIGGLGNQMFQYAYAKALQKKGFEVKIDISAFKTYKLHGGFQLNKYNIDLPISTIEENENYSKNSLFSKVLKKLNLFNSNVLKEKTLSFNHEFLKLNSDCYVEGYFQSEKYFLDIVNILQKQFSIENELSSYSEMIENEIFNGLCSCSIHIRRGDFIDSKNINIHGSCDLEYYKSAISLLNTQEKNLHYFIFSDDITWAKENLQIDGVTYIESEEKRIPHEDIYLMSLCDHNIIANSSFSWWGAWLNKNKSKKVIAPKRWFADKNLEIQAKDIVCKDWIRL